MRIISVAGATSKAGKTLLAEQIIRYCSERYTPVFAVKFTTTTDLPSPCPRGAPCTVCDLSDRFRIVRDPEILLQKGKNTERLSLAGADAVIWVISRKSWLEEAYRHLLEHIPDDALVVMEGSTITEFARPDLLLYVFANHIRRDKWKDSAERIIGEADFVVRNSRSDRPNAPLQAPPQALTLNLRENPATGVPAIADGLETLIRSLSNAVHSK